MLRTLVVIAVLVVGVAAQGKTFTYDGPAFRKGIELQSAGQEQEAFAQWRVVLLQQPGHPGAYYHAGVGRYNIGEFDKARYNLERSFDYPAKGFNAHYYLGRIAEKEGKSGEAIKHYNTYLQLTKSPQGTAEVKGRIARLSDPAEKSGKKKPMASEPVATAPKQPQAPAVTPAPAPVTATVTVAPPSGSGLKRLWMRAEEARLAGNWGEALDGWVELVARCLSDGSSDPLCRRACDALADAYYEAGRMQPAAERYRLAVERWPDPQEDAWGWYQIGNASRGWDHDGALKAYTTVIESYPKSRWIESARWKRDDITWKLQNQQLLATGEAP